MPNTTDEGFTVKCLLYLLAKSDRGGNYFIDTSYADKITIHPIISTDLRASYDFHMYIFVEQFNNVFISQNHCHVVNHSNLNESDTNI